MTLCYLGLGSNLNDPAQQLDSAVAALSANPDCELLAISPYYTTAPIGPQDQPDFVNAVVALRTRLAPLALLTLVLQLEQEAGRQRLRHWGERTLDIDILLYGELQQEDAHLIIPHPRMTQRRFVLQPLYDLAPQLQLADGLPIAQALQKVQDQALVLLERRGETA